MPISPNGDQDENSDDLKSHFGLEEGSREVEDAG